MCEEDLAKRQEYEKECSCYEIVRGTGRLCVVCRVSCVCLRTY